MLVCNVSLRPRRAAIAADLAEPAQALDASTLGYVVFATLVDDPASVRDFVDAYSGEIMLEAASASASVNAGLIYAAAIVEAATAADNLSTVSGVALVARSAMLTTAFVNSPGTTRQAGANCVMVNL